MGSWLLKAAIQGALSRLPDPQRWNRWFQAHVTRSLAISDQGFLDKYRHCAGHFEAFRRHASHGAQPPAALELGTGWLPIVPVGLVLRGARSVVTVDTVNLLTRESVVSTLERYRHFARSGELDLGSGTALARIEAVLAVARRLSCAELLERLSIRALVGDARRLELPDGSIDLVCSNNTLEHIPAEVVAEMLTEFRRLLGPRGVMSHHIDMSDHYANFDPSISIYNFLRFSDRTWALFNNRLQYQNRLRVWDFRKLHRDAGFRIVEEQNTSGPRELLSSLKLAPRFRGHEHAELAVHNTWMTSRPH